MRPSTRRALATVAILALTLAFVAPTAAARPRVTSENPAGRHCVNHLEHLAGSAREARVVSVICFSTFADALNHATGGRANARAGLTPNAVTASMVESEAGTLATVVIGIDWQYPNYSNVGWTAVWEASGGCTTTQSWALSYVGAFYEDKISSAKGYSNCNRFHHWEHPSYGGAVLICRPNCATMGLMNDQTSSLSWDR